MIDIKTLIYILLALISIGGGIVAFFQMQTRQNMRQEQQEKDLKEAKEKFEKDINGIRDSFDKQIVEIKHKQSESTNHQIKTEKNIVEISTKLDSVIEMMKELKDKGCGACK